MNIIAAGFAVVGADLIWGVGATEAEAEADAASWIVPGDNQAPEVETLPATAALIEAVTDLGGSNAYRTVNGIVCTWAEGEAAYEAAHAA